MLGRKEFTPKRFYEFSLEAQVPSDHLLRRIGAALDLSFVRRLTARFYSHTGRPGVDPVVLFKLMLLGYLYGITSERRLAEEARLHLAFRWFLGYDLDETPPDHSMLSKARARFGLPVYQAATEVVRSASGPAWCGATSSTWTARWSRPMPVLGRPARGRCSLSCRARRVRRDGVAGTPVSDPTPPAPLPARGSSRRRTRPVASRRARGARRCTWPVRRTCPTGTRGR